MRRFRHSVFGVKVVAAILAMANEAGAYHQGDERIIDQTAHTLRAREARIGVWEIEFAPVAFAMVGTDTAPWAAAFVVGSVVSNGHAKVRLLHTTPLTISVSGAAYYSKLRGTGALASGRGSLLLTPMSLTLSSDWSRRLSVHVVMTYAHVEFDGNAFLKLTHTRATMAASAIQLHATVEYRLSRVVALTAQFHAQPYATPLQVQTSGIDVIGDKSDFNGTMVPVEQTAVAASLSAVLSWRHVNSRFGAGYGAIFLPSMGVMIPMTTVFPEIDAYVRF